MLLSGLKIKELIEKGDIIIDGFKEENLNPNSYDLTIDIETVKKLNIKKSTIYTLHDEVDNYDLYNYKIKRITEDDFKTVPLITMDGNNYVFIKPDELYLATVNESIDLKGLLLTSFIGGKSSLARMGLKIHMTAAYGQIGFKGKYVLEIESKIPILIKEDSKIGQLFIDVVIADSKNNVEYYSGKYQEQNTSRL